MACKIIIIDDNVSDSNEIKRLLSGFGTDIFQSWRIVSAKDELTKFGKGDIIICKFKLTDSSVIDMMEWLNHKGIRCSIFVITDV